MNHFIETVKEQPWHKTLGMSLFAIFLVGFVVAWAFTEPMTLSALVGLVLLFWAGNSFFEFVDDWNVRRKVFKGYEVPEYKRSMHHVINPKKHTANFYAKD